MSVISVIKNPLFRVAAWLVVLLVLLANAAWCIGQPWRAIINIIAVILLLVALRPTVRVRR